MTPRVAARRWLFDLGNSRLKWVRADALGKQPAQAQGHDGRLDASTLAMACADVCPGDRAWVASVALAAGEGLLAALRQRGALAVPAQTRAACAGVRIAYAQPLRLGVDRFLGLLAAHARAPQPWLVVNVGTAVTIDLLGADGVHHGGLIAPSPTLMREALTRRAVQLPAAGGTVLDFAGDTADALASGAILAARALVERSVRAARRRLGVRPGVLLSGGGADALREGWRLPLQGAPELVLEGLARYAHHVRGDAHGH